MCFSPLRALLGPEAGAIRGFDSLGHRQSSDVHLVLGHCGNGEHPSHSLGSPSVVFAVEADPIQPPKHLLGFLLFFLADLGARVARRDLSGRAAHLPLFILCHIHYRL